MTGIPQPVAVVLSIVMPVFDEERTLEVALDRLLAVEYPCPVEVVVVDDGSRDGTGEILARSPGAQDGRITVVRHPGNLGKGAAVRSGVGRARGTHVIILDADLEYDPADIVSLLGPVLRGVADHVFGVRVFGLNTRFRSFAFAVGGRATTLAINLAFNACLTDMHTCLKLVPVSHFRALDLREDGFGLDTEVTARLLRAGVRPFEVPVSYNARSAAEGKKISWRDGVRCLAVIARVRLGRSPAALPPTYAETPGLHLLHEAPGPVELGTVIDLTDARLERELELEPELDGTADAPRS